MVLSGPDHYLLVSWCLRCGQAPLAAAAGVPGVGRACRWSVFCNDGGGNFVMVREVVIAVPFEGWWRRRLLLLRRLLRRECLGHRCHLMCRAAAGNQY